MFRPLTVAIPVTTPPAGVGPGLSRAQVPVGRRCRTRGTIRDRPGRRSAVGPSACRGPSGAGRRLTRPPRRPADVAPPGPPAGTRWIRRPRLRVTATLLGCGVHHTTGTCPAGPRPHRWRSAPGPSRPSEHAAAAPSSSPRRRPPRRPRRPAALRRGDLDDRALHRAVPASRRCPPCAAAGLLPGPAAGAVGRGAAATGRALPAASPPPRVRFPPTSDGDACRRSGRDSAWAAVRRAVGELGLDPAGVHPQRLAGERRVRRPRPGGRAARWASRRPRTRPARGPHAAAPRRGSRR